jgi:hypothetical protein
MGTQSSGKIADRVLAAAVDLGAGESVLYQSDMAYRGPWLLKSHGRLHLTTRRLIWIRWHSSLPIGLKVVQIELGDIRRCGIGRPPWRLWQKAFVVESRRPPENIWFLPLREGKETEVWREAVTAALEIVNAEAEKTA